MDSTRAGLQKLGLSPYESKAVLALLKKHPANGYQVGKIAGIPISKVYDVLGRLKNKGVVTADESITPALYYPVPVDALIARLKSGYDATIRELENELRLIAPIPELDLSWNLMGYQAVIQRAAGVLKSASKTAMLSVWQKEYGKLRLEIRAAEKRGVRVVLSLFGAGRVQDRFAIRMSSCGETSRKRLQARLMVIAADSREVVISRVVDAAETVGIVTSTPQIVLIAKEYIRHDVWSRILIDEMGEEKFNELCEKHELLSFLIKNE